MDIKTKYERWLNCPSVSDEDKELLRSYNEEQINDAFYRDLEFGTAGIRGILGPGSNRLNVKIVARATVGFALYLLETYKMLNHKAFVFLMIIVYFRENLP